MPDVYDTHPTLYKLVAAADVPDDAWSSRNSWTTSFGKMDDPKYFKLQTAEQLEEVAAKAFAGKEDVMLLEFSVEKMVEEADVEVKFEGDEPRAYADFIPYACMSAPPKKLALQDGKHVMPLVGAAAVAAAAAALAASQIDSDPNTSDDDGLAPFDQHTYDCDDDGNDALDPS